MRASHPSVRIASPDARFTAITGVVVTFLCLSSLIGFLGLVFVIDNHDYFDGLVLLLLSAIGWVYLLAVVEIPAYVRWQREREKVR